MASTGSIDSIAFDAVKSARVIPRLSRKMQQIVDRSHSVGVGSVPMPNATPVDMVVAALAMEGVTPLGRIQLKPNGIVFRNQRGKSRYYFNQRSWVKVGYRQLLDRRMVGFIRIWSSGTQCTILVPGGEWLTGFRRLLTHWYVGGLPLQDFRFKENRYVPTLFFKHRLTEQDKQFAEQYTHLELYPSPHRYDHWEIKY